MQRYENLEQDIIGLLKENSLTRAEMVEKLKIPRTTIYDYLKKLIDNNQVRKHPIYKNNMKRGRPKVIFVWMD